MILTEQMFSGSVIQEQIELETRAVREGVMRYRRLADETVRRGDGAALKPAERLLLHWYAPLVHEIRLEKRRIRRGEPDIGRDIYGRVMLMIDSERAAVVTMHEMIGRCLASPEGVRVPQLAHAIARAVFAELNIDIFKRGNRDKLRQLEKRVRSFNPLNVNWWAKKTLEDPEWERRVCVHLGVRLMWLLIQIATCADYDQEFKPAFAHESVVGDKGKTVKIIRITPHALQVIEDGHAVRRHLRPRYLPMVVPPYPWQEGTEGGYVQIRTPFVSKPSSSQKAAMAQANLAEVYKAIQAVSSTAWRINTRILDLMKQAWDQQGGLAEIPPREDSPRPEPPKDIATNEEAKKRWKLEAHLNYEHNKKLHAQRREFLSKLDIAERFSDRAAIWFPHQIDFRSRAYPVPLYLNHQGDDICRGLLEFAHSKPAKDDRAKFWLHVHAANCAGVDKVSFADRVTWVRSNWQHITASVADPLQYTWWAEIADKKPWQFLAACIALLDDEAAAHIPIQVDGTCNGLQHYAALGRDVEGAAVVNLLPADKPCDVYSKVADVARDLIKSDAAEGNPAAVLLAGQIDRDLVKQTVMTSVYGVTMVGARNQIYEKLDKLGLEDKQRYQASMYLSRMVLNAMEHVCVGAAGIMAWLRKLARIVAQHERDIVSWTTPMGFPVVQPYRAWRTARIRTILQDVTMIVKDESLPPAAGRHIDGMPPNFVHSIDATHMFMTATACQAERIEFAAVHDNYWTHAATMDRMARINREQFIKLHSRPLLINLVNELRAKYPGREFPDPPEQGTLDLTKVYESDYFFS